MDYLFGDGEFELARQDNIDKAFKYILAAWQVSL